MLSIRESLVPVHPPQPQVGPWTLEYELGRGEFGVTWRARDASGRIAALKLLDVPPADELRVLSRLAHPCIPELYGSGSEPSHWVAMELVDGDPLSELLDTPIDPEHALATMSALFDALATLHNQGSSHGDVKPANIMVQSFDPPRPWLIDFGFAGQKGVGTPAYAAPEVIGGEGGPEADVYSAAMVLWQLLHATLPFDGLPVVEAMLRRREEAPTPTAGPPWVQDLLKRALSPDPARRPRASQIVRAFRDHGLMPPKPSPELLLRRSLSVQLPTSVDGPIEAWLQTGGLMSVTGPSGSGRTHLLRRVAVLVAARGRRSVMFRGGRQGWGAVEDALELLGAATPRLGDGDARGRAVISAQALLSASTGRLTVLVDDLERLDAPSLKVLNLLQQEDLADILTVGTTAFRGALEAPLEAWDAPHLVALAKALLRDFEVPEHLVPRLQLMTAGLPGNLVRVLLAGVHTGAIRQHAAGWAADPDALLRCASEEDPLGLSALDDSVRSIGEALAAAGDALPIEDIAVIVGMPSADVRRGVRALHLRGACRASGRGVKLTTPELWRTFQATPERAQRLHRALLSRARRCSAPAETIARHAVGCRDAISAAAIGVEGVRALLRRDASAAAELSRALWDLCPLPEIAVVRVRSEIAAGHTDNARRFARKLSPMPPLVRLELARAALNLGDFEQALKLVERSARELSAKDLRVREVRAQALFRAGRHDEALRQGQRRGPLPEKESLAAAWRTLVLVEAQSLHALGQATEGLVVVRDALRLLGRGTDTIQLRGVEGRLLVVLGKLSQAREVLDQLVDPAAGLPLLDRSRTLLNLGTVLYMLGERRRAVAAWEQCQLLFSRLSAAPDKVRVEVNLCVAYRESGRVEAAIKMGERALAGAEEEGLESVQAIAIGNLGEALVAAGEHDRARAVYAQCEALAQAAGLDHVLLELARRRAEHAADTALDQAEALAKSALRLAEQANSGEEQARCLALLTLARVRRGEDDDLDEVATRIQRVVGTSGQGAELAAARLRLAQACLFADRRREANELATRTLTFSREVEHAELEDRAQKLLDDVGELPLDGDDRALDELLALTHKLRSHAPLSELLAQIGESALDLIPDADRAFVALGDPVQVVSSTLRTGELDTPPSQTILDRVVRTGREVLATDLGERGDLLGFASVADLDVRSVMCVPLDDSGRRIGALYLDSRRASQGRLARMARLLRGLAAFAAMSVERNRARTQEESQRQLARELEQALDVAEEAMRSKGRFLAKMSHELRTPLNGVMGMLDLLQRSGLSEAQDEMLGTIRGSGSALLELISRILDYARLDEGTATARVQPLDLRRVIDSSLAMVSNGPNAQGIELVAQVPPELWRSYQGDGPRLQQVLVNLIDNATRFTEPGGQVLVRVRRAGTGRLRFEVEDTGCGIPADKLVRVFEPFAQVDDSDTRSHWGVGLGLSISREAVQLLGGTLQCESTVGVGTTFAFTLPLTELGRVELPQVPLKGRRVLVQVHNRPLALSIIVCLRHWGAIAETSPQRLPDPDLVIHTAECPPPPGIEALEMHPPGQGVFSRPLRVENLALALRSFAGLRPEVREATADLELHDRRVLIVEDNLINRTVLRRMLEHVNIDVVEAENGEEALAVFDSTIDLVLMDCQLPVMDGYEATQRLRDVPGGSEVPIVAVTAHALPSDRARCLDAGMDDYLTKPISMDRVRRILTTWMPVKEEAV